MSDLPPTQAALPNDHGSSSPIRAQFAPKALEILAAAQRVVVRDGAEKLSLRAVAREAGETSSLVLYYFSSMENLEALLLDSLWHEIVLDFIADMDSMPSDVGRRIDALIEFHSRIAHEPGLYKVYVDLVAHVIPSETIRTNVARIYEGYRHDINRPLLAAPWLSEEQVDARAALVLAAGEGIPIHALMMPEPRQDLVFDLLSHLLKRNMQVADAVPGSLREAPPVDRARQRPDFDSLPTAPAAQRLIDAGQELIRTGGLRSLSLESTARVSGEARPSVGYYFGNKKGFIEAIALTALRDWVECIESQVDDREDLTGPNLEIRFFHPASPLATVVLIMPVVMRSDRLREVAEHCNAYVLQRLANAFGLTSRDGSSTVHPAVARLFTATLIGLTLQHLYDPEHFSPTSALDVLCEITLNASLQPSPAG